MKKAITSALAILIFMSSAAAGPIQMNDKELDLIHAGTDGSSLQFSLITNDGSTVFIKDGVEHAIRIGSSLSFPDGTKVEVKQNSNGYTTLVTKDGTTFASLLFVGGPSDSTAITTIKAVAGGNPFENAYVSQYANGYDINQVNQGADNNSAIVNNN